MLTNRSVPGPSRPTPTTRPSSPDTPSGSTAGDDSLVIDCEACALQHTEACGDCIMTFLCGVEASAPVVVDLAEARAMRLLGEAGLAPPLRHRDRMG